MSHDGSGCKNCKRVREHVASLLPFKIVEAMSDKPLCIRGVAICTGMSRNLNIYTSEELQAFSSKLVTAPVYIEHVAVPNAVGKVTKTDWDGHNLWYEAEIYDDMTAEKIRKGLIQHVSVGADYEAVDLVDGKVPHGLHNAELSLVAVPGIPETNVQVLEKLGDAQLQEKLTQTESKLTEAQRTIEQLRAADQSSSLLKEQPKTLPIAEAVAILERLLPVPTVERSTLGMQRECQEIRAAIHRLQGRLA